MSVLHELDGLLRSERLSQLLAGLLFAVIATLVFSWTADPLVPNDSWFNVVAVRRTGLALAAALLALSRVRAATPAQLAGLLCVVVLSLLTMPFELLTYAASYPPAGAWLSFVFDVVFPVAVGALVLVAGRLLPGRYWPALLAVPLVIAAGVVIDELTALHLFNPAATVTVSSWPLLVTWLLIALVCAGLLAGQRGADREQR